MRIIHLTLHWTIDICILILYICKSFDLLDGSACQVHNPQLSLKGGVNFVATVWVNQNIDSIATLVVAAEAAGVPIVVRSKGECYEGIGNVQRVNY